MRSQNRNYNSVGWVGCLGLLALGLALVNPVTSAVYAYDSAPGDGEETGNGSSSSSVASSVQIAFGEPVGVAELTPVSSDGASAKYSVKAIVSIQNSGGYAVYLGSNKSELTGKNTGATINAVTSSSTYANLPLNSWGYNAVEGETAEDSYSAVPTNNRGDIIGENTSNNIKSDEKTFTLSFATHISNDKPADTYENEVTMSVVSSPLEVVLVPVYNEFSIEYLQDMTSSICSAAAAGTTGQLFDQRDNKPYWVTKLADGNCWMTQNLALDLSTSKALMPEDSDVASSWIPEFSTTSKMDGWWDQDNPPAYDGTRSWSQAGYVLGTPLEKQNCGANPNALSLAECASVGFVHYQGRSIATDPDFFSKSSYLGTDGSTLCTKDANTALSVETSGVCAQYDAHYTVGNYYQWNAAVAGSGTDLIGHADYAQAQTADQLLNATNSVCPKGWRLPVGGTNASKVVFNQPGSFGNLLVKSGWASASDSNVLVEAPVFLMRAGNVYNSSSSTPGIRDAGKAGVYWTASSRQPNNSCPFNYSIDGNGVINAGDSYGYAYSGASVRCVAR